MNNLSRVTLRKFTTTPACAILKTIFTQAVVCMMILLCVFTYSHAKGEDGIEVLAIGGLKEISASQNSLFDKDKTIVEGTEKYLGEAVSVMAQANPFKTAILPVSGTISSGYGYRQDPFTNEMSMHNGVDIAVQEGTPVHSVMDGVVITCGNSSISGNYIQILHKNGYSTYYGHLQTQSVQQGDAVKKGEQIAISGNTGHTTGPHLHFGIMKENETINPEKYFYFHEN